MIPKKGFCITRLVRSQGGTVGGIGLPESNSYGTDRYEVTSLNGESGLRIGDHVVFAENPSRTVRIDFNGERLYVRSVDDALAVVKDGDGEAVQDAPYVASPPDVKVEGVGEKVVISGRRITGTYRAGQLLIPYERRELGRLNYGPVASLSASLSERTGIVPGMYVLYDYHSTYGHFDGFDVTNEENVVAILSEADVRHMEEG